MPNRLASLLLICPTCNGTRYSTCDDRHAETIQDICRGCGGEGKILPKTGETPEAAYRPVSAPQGQRNK